MKTLKENTLREEFIKEYLNEPFVLGKSELSDIADFWLQKRQSEFDELERRIREERIKDIRNKEDAADSGQFDVAYEQGEDSGFNKGLDRTLDILNEMRGEK